MKIKTFITDSAQLANVVNDIGWGNVLQILPEHRYNGTLFVIIYKESDKEEDNDK